MQYRQSCPCRGRALSASRDFDRYEREILDLSRAILGLITEQNHKERTDPSIAGELVRLEHDRSRARENRHKAFRRLLEPTGRSCPICEDKGYRDTPGQIGSFDRRPANLRGEKIT